jgi:hypothetical protein
VLASSPPRNPETGSAHFLDAWIAPAIILLVLGSSLFGQDRLAFRDVGHFYTPLYQYVAQRTSEQWLPLWNDRCQTGMPLLGETTTAVLYPVRYQIGSLPISAERQIAWYVALHLILASLTARGAAARTGARRAGRMVAGLTYPLSGSVLFLYCNPPFLVAAAWLPLALSMLINPAKTSIQVRVCLSALAIAMMVLAGDPQTALHVMIIATAVTLMRLLLRKTDRYEIIMLVATAVLSAALAAPQIAATISWSRQSDRTDQGLNQREAMKFSVPPWHFAELFTPNLSGSLTPVNRRISTLIPGDGQMWTMTLFMGLLPMVMLLDRLTRWRRTRCDVWLCIALLAGSLAMGHFGIVWWLQWMTGSLRDFDSATWGSYWWLYQCLPGYDALRYPAKWLPFFAMGMSIACAGWVDDNDCFQAPKAIKCTGAILILSLIGIAWIPLKHLPTICDELWGPLDVFGARSEVLFSLTFSLGSLIALSIVFLKFLPCHPHRAVCWMIVLLAIELTWSASIQVGKVSVADEQTIFDRHGKDLPESPMRLLRMQRDPLWPGLWQETSSQDRLLQVEAHSRAAFFGRWHLAGEHAVVNNFVSIRSRHHADFWKTITEVQSGGRSIDWNAIQGWLAVDRVIVQSSGRLSSEQTTPDPSEIELLSNWRSCHPSALKEEDFHNRILEIASGAGGRALAVSSSVPTADPRTSSKAATGFVKASSPESLLVDVSCDQAVLLVRPIYQDGNWIVERRIKGVANSDWQASVVSKVDFLKQGTIVPPGRWELRFSYQPWWWLPSIGIALVAWAAVGIALYQRTDRRSDHRWIVTRRR